MKMEDRIMQKGKIVEIFRSLKFAPLFKRNPAYCTNQLATLTPYISFKDMTNNRIIIRGSSVGSETSPLIKSGLIIKEYNNLDDLVDDGWQIESYLLKNHSFLN